MKQFYHVKNWQFGNEKKHNKCFLGLKFKALGRMAYIQSACLFQMLLLVCFQFSTYNLLTCEKCC